MMAEGGLWVGRITMNTTSATSGIKLRSTLGPWFMAFIPFPVLLSYIVQDLVSDRFLVDIPQIIWGSIAMVGVLWCSEVWYRQIKKDNEGLLSHQTPQLHGLNLAVETFISAEKSC
jgi:hypothetical protein